MMDNPLSSEPVEAGDSSEDTLASIVGLLQSLDEAAVIDGLRRLRASAASSDAAAQYVDASPKCVEVLNAWDAYGQQRPGSRVATEAAFCLAALLDLAARIGKRTWGLNLTRAVIRQRMLRLQRMLSQERHRPVVAALVLLAHIAGYSTATARELQRSFDWQSKSLSKLAAPKKKGDVRSAFVRFALSFLRVGDRSVLRTALTTPRLVTSVVRGLDHDPAALVADSVAVLRERVVDNDAVPRRLLSSFFSANLMEHLGRLFPCVDGDVKAQLGGLLESLCCDPDRGLASPNPYWSADGPGKTQKQSTAVLSMLLSLRPHADPHQRRVVERVLTACPDLAMPYLAAAPPALEPRPSLKWIAALSLLSFAIELPPPPFRAWMRDGAPPSSPGAVLDSIVPHVVPKGALTRGLLHANAHVCFHTLSAVTAAFGKLEAVRAAAGEHGGEWDTFWRAVQGGLRQRLPDIQVLNSVRHRVSNVASLQSDPAPARQASTLVVGMTGEGAAEEDDLVAWSGVSVAQLQPLLYARVLHALTGYRRFLSESFVEARFDMAKVVGDPSSEPAVVQLALLDLLAATPPGPWWLGGKQGASPLHAVLLLVCQATGEVAVEARRVAASAISSLVLATECDAVERWLSVLEAPGAALLESAVATFLSRPHHYISQHSEALSPLDLAAIDAIRAGPTAGAVGCMAAAMLEAAASCDAPAAFAAALSAVLGDGDAVWQQSLASVVRYGQWLCSGDEAMPRRSARKKADLDEIMSLDTGVFAAHIDELMAQCDGNFSVLHAYLAAHADWPWVSVLGQLVSTAPFTLVLAGSRAGDLASEACQAALMGSLSRVSRRTAAATHVLNVMARADTTASVLFCLHMLAALATDSAAAERIVRHEWLASFWGSEVDGDVGDRVVRLLIQCNGDGDVIQAMVDWALRSLESPLALSLTTLGASLLTAAQGGAVVDRLLATPTMLQADAGFALLSALVQTGCVLGVSAATLERLVELCKDAPSDVLDELLCIMVAEHEHVGIVDKDLVKLYCRKPTPTRMEVLRFVVFGSSDRRRTFLRWASKRVSRGKWSHSTVLLPLLVDALAITERAPHALRSFGADVLESGEWDGEIAVAAYWAACARDNAEARGMFASRAMECVAAMLDGGEPSSGEASVTAMLSDCLRLGCSVPPPPRKKRRRDGGPSAKAIPFLHGVVRQRLADSSAVEAAAMVVEAGVWELDPAGLGALLDEMGGDDGFPSLLSSNSHLAFLVHAVASRSPSHCRPVFLPWLMAAYSGGSDPRSRWLSQCLGLWEREGCGPAEVNYVWGPEATAQAEMMAMYAVPSDKISAGLFDDVIDVRRVRATLACFDQDAPIPSPRPTPVERALPLAYVEPADPHDEPYDVAFVLSLLRAVVHETDVDPRRFVDMGGVSVPAIALSSHQESTRAVSYDILAHAFTLFESRRALPLVTLLVALRNTVTEPNQRIPATIGAFVGRAAEVMARPDHMLFRAVSRALVRAPHFDPESVPVVFDVLGGGGVQHRQERVWAMDTLAAGLVSDEDAKLCAKKRFLPVVMAFFGSPLADESANAAVQRLVARSCRLPATARDLLESRGLASWPGATAEMLRAALGAVKPSVARRHARGSLGMAASGLLLRRDVLRHAAPRDGEAVQAARLALIPPETAAGVCALADNGGVARALALDVLTAAPLRVFDAEPEQVPVAAAALCWCLEAALDTPALAAAPGETEPLATRAVACVAAECAAAPGLAAALRPSGLPLLHRLQGATASWRGTPLRWTDRSDAISRCIAALGE